MGSEQVNLQRAWLLFVVHRADLAPPRSVRVTMAGILATPQACLKSSSGPQTPLLDASYIFQASQAKHMPKATSSASMIVAGRPALRRNQVGAIIS